MSATNADVEIRERIDRQFANADPGDWMGVFENQDLGHPQLGQRVAFMFGAEDWDPGLLTRHTTAPDGSFGLGWRYTLVRMCKTADEAKAAMTTIDCEYCGQVWEHLEPRWGETDWYREVHDETG